MYVFFQIFLFFLADVTDFWAFGGPQLYDSEALPLPCLAYGQ